MKKKNKKYICHECETQFTLTVTSSVNKKVSPEICPFCGDIVDLVEERPLLKNFDEYDELDDASYYIEEDDDYDG